MFINLIKLNNDQFLLAFLKEAPEWSGWSFPFMRDTGELLHATLYCSDVLAFARRFLELSGMGARRQEPRSLQQLQRLGDEEEMSLEHRNQNFLKGTFFNAFHAVREGQIAAGVSYAVVNNAVTRNEELALVYNLEPGNEQFLNDGRESDTNMSVWVSNHGFFYVLRSVHAQPEVCHARVDHEGEWESAASFVSGY